MEDEENTPEVKIEHKTKKEKVKVEKHPFADSEGRAPGDKGYNLAEVSRGIREQIKIHTDAITDLKENLRLLQATVQEATPKLSSREAIRASQRLARKLKEDSMTRERKIQEKLTEMGLLPK